MAEPSKGEHTRLSILDSALAAASRLGLEGLTIGSLAGETGLSKSGLFAHFGSREELQRAVLEHGARRFGERVLVPAIAAERGLPRLRALFENWIDWTVATGLPGGCVLIAAAYEYDDRPGAMRDAVAALQRQGLGVLNKAVRLAIEAGHLRPDADPAQIAFELLGIVLVSHHNRRLLGDREARRRALVAYEALIARFGGRNDGRVASGEANR
jgi:AcrR family transcriptional regulator